MTRLMRVLEPEVMDTALEARDYDSMDHSAVNRLFVQDFLALGGGAGVLLDVGTGTAQIPIELCRQHKSARVVAVDAARHMLELGRYNVQAAGFEGRIRLECCDAKRLPHADGSFDAVISNSIVHHIPEPITVLREMVRVVRGGGRLFVRDLLRPAEETTLAELVQRHAGGANEHQKRMLAESLHAALTVEELRDLVAALGFDPADVRQTSDRHWTWATLSPCQRTLSPC